MIWEWPNTAISIGSAILLAVIARWLVHRAIGQAVRNAQKRTLERTGGPAGRLTGRAERVLASATGYNTDRHAQRTATIGSLLTNISTVVIVGIALLTVMSALGFDLAPVLASAGVGGIALGFGAQSLVKDFLSGVFMILEDQYGVGDLIDTGEVIGTVEEVTLRVTRLRDGSGVMWYVRNGEIVRIANRSQGWSTALVDIPVSSAEDPERALAALRAAMAELDADPHWQDLLLDSPEVAGVESVVGSTMTLRVLARCAPNENLPIQREIRERSLRALQAADIAPPPVSGWTGPA